MNKKTPLYFACFLMLMGALLLTGCELHLYETVKGMAVIIGVTVVMLLILVGLMFK